MHCKEEKQDCKAKIKKNMYGAPSELDMNPNVTIFDIKEKCTTEVNIEIGILKEECQLQIQNAKNVI